MQEHIQYCYADRPTSATHEGLRKCLKWLDDCKALGWPEESMTQLEGIFWYYHNEDGILKYEFSELKKALFPG